LSFCRVARWPVHAAVRTAWPIGQPADAERLRWPAGATNSTHLRRIIKRAGEGD
jgi:hypothetical protein